MKTETVKGESVVVIKERGLGDGGIVLRYFVEESDGTHSQVGEWYSDPATAEKVYAAPDETHMDWIVGEARRQTVKAEERVPQAERPLPEALKAASVKDG